VQGFAGTPIRTYLSQSLVYPMKFDESSDFRKIVDEM
jgi:hypothetical protein